MSDDADDPSIERWLTTEGAAKLLGVGVSSVKRWVDQGLLEATKTPGGHRRIDRAQLQRVAGAAKGADGANAVLANAHTDADSILALFRGKATQQELVAFVRHKKSQLGHWAAVGDLLAEALALLGRLWLVGEVSVLEEHEVSDRFQRVLIAIASELEPPPGADSALLLTAPGDEHTLGLLLVEVALRELGFRAVWAGRQAPLDQVLNAIQRNEFKVVAVSASAASMDPALLSTVATRLASACRAAGATLLLGGSGAWPETALPVRRLRSLRALRTESASF